MIVGRRGKKTKKKTQLQRTCYKSGNRIRGSDWYTRVNAQLSSSKVLRIFCPRLAGVEAKQIGWWTKHKWLPSQKIMVVSGGMRNYLQAQSQRHYGSKEQTRPSRQTLKLLTTTTNKNKRGGGRLMMYTGRTYDVVKRTIYMLSRAFSHHLNN